jgi:hypothetical protein
MPAIEELKTLIKTDKYDTIIVSITPLLATTGKMIWTARQKTIHDYTAKSLS